MSDPMCRVLCLDGGGYLGTATASFLRGLEQHFDTTCHESFDLFVGTSTGGIIATAFASGMSGDQVVELYRKLGTTVFPAVGWFGRLARCVRGLFRPRYAQHALRKALEEAFGGQTLDDLASRGKYVAIPAFNTARGSLRIFKTNHHRTLLTNDGKIKLVDIALATSAAPTYFPLADVHNARDGATEAFVDGGVFANNPALIGVMEALVYLEHEPAEIQVLSVSTPRLDPRLPTDRLRAGGGILSWARILPGLLIDSSSALTDRAVEVLSRRLGVHYERVTLAQAQKPLSIDDASDAATNELLSIGAHEARNNDLRRKLSIFFTKRGYDGRATEVL